MVILQQMMIFALMMLIGIGARRCGMITQTNQKQLSAIVVNIANPALIISGSITEGERIQEWELLSATGVAIIVFAVMILLAYFLAPFLGFRREERCVIRLMFIFSNIGFIGMPMVSGIYGERALIYVTLFLIIYNVLFYTFGVFTLGSCMEKKGKVDFSKLFNPGVLACGISLLLYLGNIALPYILTESVTMLSQLTGPLSMMIIGAALLDINLWETFTDVRMLVLAALKMLILPVILLLILKQFITNDLLLGVCLIMVATPAGSMIAMLAGQYNDDFLLFCYQGCVNDYNFVSSDPSTGFSFDWYLRVHWLLHCKF